MRKIFKSTLIFVFIVIFSSASLSFADEIDEGNFKPLSPKFLEWQEQHRKNSPKTKVKSSQEKSYSGGYIPIPVDLSHLEDNIPIEIEVEIEDYESGRFAKSKATTVPSKYDLRNVNGENYLTSVKDQGDYGTCWAHSSLGSMESNMLKQKSSAFDLSEMHLAWFAFKNSDISKTFYDLNSAGFDEVLNNGGNAFFPTALYSRLAGPVDESDAVYGSKISKTTPESYTRLLRLKEVYCLKFTDNDINAAAIQKIVKRRIMDNGSVMASYTSDNNGYQKTSNGTAYYSTSSSGERHAIQLVGWNDSYAVSNFKKKPSAKGAWLAKNSWGTDWGDKGYFWISYKQDLDDGISFVVEPSDSNMNVYYYDSLGWTGTWGSSSFKNIFAANVFKSNRNETLTEIGLYTQDNNVKYEINVYKLSSMPSSNPISRSSLSTVSGSIAYAGYHTVELNTPVGLSSGEYFSVVVQFKSEGYVPVEMKSPLAPHAYIEEGSFFSTNGSTWITGISRSMNACIKAFTTSGSSGSSAPEIITSALSEGSVGLEYSSTVTASGTQPISWSLSGNVPSGLSINSSTGKISGTPSKAGNYTFTVRASNSAGNGSKSFTINIYNAPTLSVTEFSGYAGYNFDRTLTLTSGSAYSWTASTKLPSGLTLNSSTGQITGKPSSAKTTTTKILIATEYGNFTAEVTFVIYSKPSKPSIKPSTLTSGLIGKEYEASLTVKGTEPVTLTAENCPDGIYFDSSTGTFSGTPTKTGTFTIKISASNIATYLSGGTPVTKNIKMIVKAVPPVIKTPDDLTDAVYGEKYDSVQFETSEGTEPVTWSASGLPKGMTVNSSGVLSGTPAKEGNFKITLKASNSGGKDTVKIPLKVLQKPSLKTLKISDATTDKNYNVSLSAIGTKPIEWNIEGLPSTLSYTEKNNGASINIKGTPVEIGEYDLTITLSNSAGTYETPAKLKVKGVSPSLSITLSSGKVGTYYNKSKIKAKGTKPITISYSISSTNKKKFGIESLEDLGLSFSCDPEEGTAEITGTPTTAFKSLQITFKAENAVSSVTKNASFTVNAVKTSASKTSNSISLIKNQRQIPNTIQKIEDEGYIIAEVLAELTVEESGMFDFKDEIELKEEIKTGYKLYWFACPQDSEPSDDDEIAEFYNVEGEEIETVPEDHKIYVSAWLNEGVKYIPVIAVKADE